MTKSINIALQGGGAHGAFTWGVLDKLLEDGRIDLEAITATSAGAMNAAAYAQGFVTGGKDGARESLHEFWRAISEVGALFGPVQRTALDWINALNPFSPNWSMEKSPGFALFDAVTRSISPYQFNPANFNLLRDLLERQIDFERIHDCNCIKLFISATNVQTGQPKVFYNEDVTLDVLTASAALPYLFHAVEIDGAHYWDGGYMGNPSLWPLFYRTDSRDILIVHINPIRRSEIPKEAYAIENRINEISFNGSLLKDIRAIAFVKKLIKSDMLKDEYKDHYKDVLLHAIRTENVMCDLSVASKFDTSWQFLTYLRDLGREQAEIWLDANYKSVGKKSSVSIQDDYLL